MNIDVLVYRNSHDLSENKKCFARSLEWDSSLVFPFEDTIKVLRCLYGCISVVTIIVLSLCIFPVVSIPKG